MHFNLPHNLNTNGGIIVYRFSIICFISLLSLNSRVKGQRIFPVNNQNKIEYFSEILLDSINPAITWDSLVSFMEGLKLPEGRTEGPQVHLENRKIESQFGFYLYRETAFLKQIEGLISAQILAIFDKQFLTLYIYQIEYLDYERDRYGTFSPKTSRKYSLETLIRRKKGDLWNEHFKTIDSYMIGMIDEFENKVLVYIR